MAMDREAKKWKRRERAMLYGLVTWAFGIGALATLRPEWTAQWILDHTSFQVAGVIMFTVGLLGAIFDYGQQLAANWIEEGEDLTERPWEDDDV